MDPRQIVHSDPEILGGTPVFVGTRVPVDALIDFLEGGDTIESSASRENRLKRVLFDENLPRLLRRSLLRQAVGRFDVLLTEPVRSSPEQRPTALCELGCHDPHCSSQRMACGTPSSIIES